MDNDLHKNKADALKYCASYIEEEFEICDVNFSSKIPITKEKSDPTTTKKTFWETRDECPEDIDSSISRYDKNSKKMKSIYDNNVWNLKEKFIDLKEYYKDIGI